MYHKFLICTHVPQGRCFIKTWTTRTNYKNNENSATLSGYPNFLICTHFPRRRCIFNTWNEYHTGVTKTQQLSFLYTESNILSHIWKRSTVNLWLMQVLGKFLKFTLRVLHAGNPFPDFRKTPYFLSVQKTGFNPGDVSFLYYCILYFYITSHIALYLAVCDVVISFFYLSGVFSLSVTFPDFPQT